MLRRSVFIVLLLLVPIAVDAAPSPGPTASGEARAGARDGGVVEGRITGVDYQKSTIAVDGGNRGRLTVTVMPSTNIQGKDAAYHTITDLKSGVRVQIFTSLNGDVVVAQIIRILQ
jgi:hypothetical protein